MKSRIFKIFLLAIFILGLGIGGYTLYGRGRHVPVPLKQKLYEGVIYRREVRLVPRPMVVHTVRIDTREKGVSFLVTPPDSDGERPLYARTTSQFLEEFGLQIAINGDGFTPWWSHGVVDYYPQVGDPVTPFGFAASEGKVYWNGENMGDIGIEPTLYISRRNALSFNRRPNNVYSAISGDRMLIEKGETLDGLDDSLRDPRTAIGLNRNGRYLYIVLVDGRQPGYSEGATFVELAGILKEQGAWVGMAMDGGGSSTLAVEGEDGLPRILNTPIDNLVPGRERAIGNHLGIYVK